jgi:putative hydrolase of the HAD superfamily
MIDRLVLHLLKSMVLQYRVRRMNDNSISTNGQARFAEPRDVAHIETWIFDLDNTLYPAHCRLFDQVDQKIGDYVATYFQIDQDSARLRQKEFYHNHGSTLRGMMLLHGMEPDDYLEYVHDIDLSPVPADPLLDEVLSRIPGRKLVFTSATTTHAERVMTKLGVIHHFEDIFDVAAADYIPKPHAATYDRLIDRYAIDPKASVFFDDIPRNLKPAADIGMTTVWIPGHHNWAKIEDDGEYIHFVAEHLAGWLDVAVPR